jgi:hypothetical protein
MSEKRREPEIVEIEVPDLKPMADAAVSVSKMINKAFAALPIVKFVTTPDVRSQAEVLPPRRPTPAQVAAGAFAAIPVKAQSSKGRKPNRTTEPIVAFWIERGQPDVTRTLCAEIAAKFFPRVRKHTSEHGKVLAQIGATIRRSQQWRARRNSIPSHD